jgi:thiol-disulfide isomerase/thioredoxin
MYKTIQEIYAILKPYNFYILVGFVVTIFALIAYFGYKRYAMQYIDGKEFKDVANANRRSVEANVYFFHVDWCPHCVKAKPQWELFNTAYNGSTINGYKIITHSIDCNADLDDNMKDLIETYKIESYPTVKLIIDGEPAVELDSKITKETLVMFVKEVLNNPGNN